MTSSTTTPPQNHTLAEAIIDSSAVDIFGLCLQVAAPLDVSYSSDAETAGLILVSLLNWAADTLEGGEGD